MPKTKEEKIKEQQEKTRKCYQDLFLGETGEFVLNDLKKFCYGEKSTFSEIISLSNFRQGMRNVYLHILQRMKDKPKEE